MKLLEKLFNRYNIIRYIVFLLMLALSFRLATLTIVEGDHYRDMSDNKRLKEVHITAPRGEIRDRYGRLLAGSIPSFTVQLLKDELNLKDKDSKNDALLSLIRLLEEDGVDYVGDFPLSLNIYKYKNDNDYLEEELSPNDKVVETIIEEGILGEVLMASYKHLDYEEHFKFAIVDRAINVLKDKYPEVTTGAYQVEDLVTLINNDKTTIRKIIGHPLSRKLVYEILERKNLRGNIIMEEYSLNYDEEYKNQKRILMNSFTEITENTTAKEDFVSIVTNVSINRLLERVKKVEGDKGEEEVILPGKILIDMIQEKGTELPISIELSEDKSMVYYNYTGSSDIGESTPLEILISYAKESQTLPEFIVRDDIKGIAQEQLLHDGVNPRISIANDFEYVFINNKKNWFEAYKIDKGSTNKEAFDELRKWYDIPKELSPYEAHAILSLYEILSKQGHFAYQPINIAYGIKDSTVAKIEEGLVDVPGIKISIEPVRYYPEGETAAHILGYLGKISTSTEIKKYVEEKKYSPNDIIGKTGIEESFEEVLRGVNGVRKVEVDVLGNTTKVLEERKPVPGNNVYLAMDSKLQQFAEDALERTLKAIQVGGTYESPWGDYKFGINKSKGRPYKHATSGSVVVMNVKTGEVLAMVSYPSYDPNLFSTGISQNDWQSLFPEDDKNPLAPRPLYNIATQTAVQPGSTFKMVTALAALEKGLSPYKAIRDMGKVDIGNQPFGCWAWNQGRWTHGYENMFEALRDSCNYYFYTLALGYNQKTGESLGMKLDIEDITNMSKQLGLNDKAGIEINIPAEISGGVPDPQRKIIITKNSLRNTLKRDLREYIKEDVQILDNELKEIIEEIVSWTELEEPLSRGEVVRRLDGFGIDPEKRLIDQKTGKTERSGIADKIKYDYLNQAGWDITDTLNVTIGQGQNSYTPLQMANFIATISNGGYRHKATLIDNVKNYNNSKILMEQLPESERIELKDYKYLDYIKEGMYRVTDDGTSRTVFNKFPIKVGAKTGTAQREGKHPDTEETYDDFAWSVGFGPYEDPEIAVATVIFQGGSGGYGAPLARDIIAEYLGLNAVGTKEPLPFTSSLVE